MNKTILTLSIIILSLVNFTAYAAFGGTHPELGTEIISLPQAISTQGKYYLSSDHNLNMASGAAIDIQANSVTVNFNGYKVGNLAAGPGTNAYGVFAFSRKNITVKNGTIRGFKTGIHLKGITGRGHVIKNMRLDGNTHWAMETEGDGIRIQNNTVASNGGGTTPGNYAGVLADGGQALTIRNNRFFNMAGGNGQVIYGVLIYGTKGVAITGNVINNSTASPGDTAISIENNATVIIENNNIQNFERGVYEVSGVAKCRNNMTIGVTTGFTNCALFGTNN